MTEIGTIDRPSIAKPASRPRSAKPATVSASAMAAHLDCTRAYIRKLEAEGVIQRQGDGFLLDQSRVAYLRYLRRERKQSPKGEADSAFTLAKAELIQLRIQERKRILINAEEVFGQVDELVGLFLSGLSGFAARIGGRDMQTRHAVDKAVYDLRLEISRAADALADKYGEPPNDNAK